MPRGHKKRISKYWHSVSYHGAVMENCRLIAFKTPVPTKGVNAKQLINSIATKNRALGLVIDLTDTDKYYDPAIFTEANVEHVKLMCDGQSVPTEKTVRLFKAKIASYMRLHAHDMTIVGVHCTHGINRTGYLICRYLIDELGYTPDRAMQEFANCRGYRIDRVNLVRDLLTRGQTESKEPKKKCTIQ